MPLTPTTKAQATLEIGTVLRMPNYLTRKGEFRVWRIVGGHCGDTHQESFYELQVIDQQENETLRVPFIMIETLAQNKLIEII